MNIHTRTALDIASAISGKRRVEQDVRVVTSTYFGGDEPRRIVLVTPVGSERGEYYEIYRERTLEALRSGMSPDELDLEPYEAEV